MSIYKSINKTNCLNFIYIYIYVYIYIYILTKVKSVRDGGTKKIAGVARKDRKRNDDTMTELGLMMDIIYRIQQKRLRYFSHVVRMKNYRLPKIALYERMN